MILCLAFAGFIWSQRGSGSARLRDFASFAFALTVVGEGTRRAAQFVLSFPLFFMDLSNDPWRIAGVLGYSTFVLLTWKAFHVFRIVGSQRLLILLLGMTTMAWLIENEAFVLWQRWIQLPVLSVLRLT